MDLGWYKMTVAGWFLVMILAVSLDPALSHDKGKKSAKGVSESIKKEKNQLKELQKKLDHQESKKRAAEKKEKSTLGRLEKIDHQLVAKKKKLASIGRQLNDRARARLALEREMEGLKAEIEDKRKRVKQSVRVLYQESRFNTLRIMLASTDYYDFMKKYYYLSFISRKESEILRGYNETVAHLGVKQKEMRQVMEDLKKDKNKAAFVVSEVRSERSKKSRLLASIRKDKSLHERAISELKDSANRVNNLIKELERKRERSSKDAGFLHLKGKMKWPTVGKVVAYFGRQKHPKFDTFINRKGIEIDAQRGSSIRAVYEGVVVYADWFRGYGQMIILDHGEGYYSLYAHAGKLMVSVSDRVKTEQVIGEIGDTGLTEDPNLYFEIRLGGKPMDPLAWLKRR